MRITNIVFVSLIVLLGLLSSCGNNNVTNYNANSAIKLIHKEELRKEITANPTLQLVDVRTNTEFNNGFIKPAINIDYYNSDFVNNFKQFDKDKPLYLYCKSGGRSNKAAHLLAEEGFTKIYDLEGGYLQWKKQ